MLKIHKDAIAEIKAAERVKKAKEEYDKLKKAQSRLVLEKVDFEEARKGWRVSAARFESCLQTGFGDRGLPRKQHAKTTRISDSQDNGHRRPEMA